MNTTTEFQYPDVRELTRKDRAKLSELLKVFAEKTGNDKAVMPWCLSPILIPPVRVFVIN